MCGIVGYLGKKSIVPTLMRGLARLEYRGYDSAGIAWQHEGEVTVVKSAGKLDQLAAKLAVRANGSAGGDGQLHVGIAHTRWATHGGPTESNAHPHSGCKRQLQVVHNGIIENYATLKERLQKTGHVFKSETDTEVLAHLFEEISADGTSLPQAVRRGLQQVRGTYGILVMDPTQPDQLIAARHGSPLVVGVGDGEYLVASDISPIIEHTAKVVYLEDGEMATITPAGLQMVTIASHQPVTRGHESVEWTVDDVERGGYAHYMLKEIVELRAAVPAAQARRRIAARGLAKLGGLELVADRLAKIKRVTIIACGTAYHAGLVGEYMLEEYAGIPTEVMVASEFRYRKPVLDEGTAVIAISQSGETADTIASIQEAKQKGCLVLGIVNVVGSTIARMTDAGVYLHVGPEIGVASTKAYTGMLTVLSLVTVLLGRQRQMSLVTGQRIVNELKALPAKIEQILTQRVAIAKLADRYQAYPNFLYLGRKYNFPSALEGALKLKEISYVHAEGYPSGELKHGPLAMIDANFPSVFLAPQDSVYEKNVSNLQELRARGGPVIAVATVGDEQIAKLANDVIWIPKTLEMLTPILAAVPLQLFAYEIALLRGCAVDQPRNLAKSVTVE